METQKNEGEAGCGHKCDSCSLGRHEMPTTGGDLVGWKLAGAGVLTFLFPLILAIMGVVFAGGEKTRQVVGAMVGLIIGILIAATTVRLLKKVDRNPNKPDTKNCDIEEIKEHR